VYKERSYDELKSQTEKNDSNSKKCLPEKMQVRHLVKEEILPCRKLAFESESDFEDDDDLSDCDFSVLPLAKRSITQQIAEDSENCDVTVDAPAILKSEPPTPRTASAELDLLDEFSNCEADLNFDLDDDGAHIYVFGQPVQLFSAVC
jgi:hypothetical protein